MGYVCLFQCQETIYCNILSEAAIFNKLIVFLKCNYCNKYNTIAIVLQCNILFSSTGLFVCSMSVDVVVLVTVVPIITYDRYVTQRFVIYLPFCLSCLTIEGMYCSCSACCSCANVTTSTTLTSIASYGFYTCGSGTELRNVIIST